MPKRRPTARAELEQSVLDAGRRVSQAAVLYHSRVAAHFGLGATDMKALDLVQSLGPLTPADLADRLGFTPASVTALLDRLEAKRLLRRVPHPSDGRRRLVEFDPDAMARLHPVYAPFFTSLHEMLATYTDHELAIIDRAFRDVADRQLAAAHDLGRVDGIAEAVTRA
jgi:DNA-binding MarR family transcriptional regulator